MVSVFNVVYATGINAIILMLELTEKLKKNFGNMSLELKLNRERDYLHSLGQKSRNRYRRKDCKLLTEINTKNAERKRRTGLKKSHVAFSIPSSPIKSSVKSQDTRHQHSERLKQERDRRRREKEELFRRRPFTMYDLSQILLSLQYTHNNVNKIANGLPSGDYVAFKISTMCNWGFVMYYTLERMNLMKIKNVRSPTIRYATAFSVVRKNGHSLEMFCTIQIDDKGEEGKMIFPTRSGIIYNIISNEYKRAISNSSFMTEESLNKDFSFGGGSKVIGKAKHKDDDDETDYGVAMLLKKLIPIEMPEPIIISRFDNMKQIH